MGIGRAARLAVGPAVRRTWLTILCALICSGTPVAVGPTPSAAAFTLARASAAAVHGRVAAIAAAWDADILYTFVTIDVARSWGLAGAPSRVIVKQLGGVLGDTALVIGGQAAFELGEDVFLLLDVRPRDRTLSVAGLSRGKWRAGTLDPVALEALADEVGRDARADAAILLPRLAPAGPSLSADAPAFSWLTPAGPARWHEADAGVPVYVDAQTGGHPLFPGGGIAQIIDAAARWSAAGTLTLRPGTYRGPRCFSNAEPADGRISITFGDPCGEIADASTTLAIGGAYYTSSDVRAVNGVDFWKITKAMVVTDNVLAKFSGMSTGCWDELMTHELGHAIGLGHSDDTTAVMYPTISTDCAARTTSRPLARDDLDGLSALYPRPPGQSGPPGPPVGLSAAVTGSTVALQWMPPASGGAATTYYLLAGSRPGASDAGGAVIAQPAFTATKVVTGVYYVRVHAANALGASPASDEIAVIVGQGLPGVPSGLLAAATAGSVVVHWQPPTSGPSPSSYRLLAHRAAGAAFEIPVGGTTYASQAVPSGTYYVRVLAVNATGAGPVSPEIAVVVP